MKETGCAKTCVRVAGGRAAAERKGVAARTRREKPSDNGPDDYIENVRSLETPRPEGFRRLFPRVARSPEIRAASETAARLRSPVRRPRPRRFFNDDSSTILRELSPTRTKTRNKRASRPDHSPASCSEKLLDLQGDLRELRSRRGTRRITRTLKKQAAREARLRYEWRPRCAKMSATALNLSLRAITFFARSSELRRQAYLQGKRK